MPSRLTRTTRVLAATAAATLALGTSAAVSSAAGSDNPLAGTPLASILEPGATGGLQAVGLADGGTKLVVFNTATPSQFTSSATVRGLRAGAKLVGIDYRVQDNRLWGLSSDGRLYRLTVSTGQAVLSSNKVVPLDRSVAFDIDFNPAANALRIVSANGQNLRVPFANPNTAAVRDTTLSRPVVPATTPPTTQQAVGITAAAYTNNDLAMSTATTLYDLDTARDQLTIQSPANSGQTAAVGNLGVNLTLNAGFDIYSAREGGVTTANVAYAVHRSALYEVDLTTGRATAAGTVPNVSDLAIVLSQG